MIDLNKYKGLIFDFDGTLVDTEKVHYKSFVEVLKIVELEYISFDKHIKQNSGRKGKVIIDEFLKDNNINADSEELFTKKKAIFSRMINEGVDIIPGAIKFLQKVKSKDFKLGLVTGSAKESFDSVTSKANIDIEIFDVLITGKDNYEPKPSPEGFLLALERLNLAKEEALIFEDSLNGVKSGNAAGADVCFIQTYLNEEDILKHSKFTYSVKDFKELIL